MLCLPSIVYNITFSIISCPPLHFTCPVLYLSPPLKKMDHSIQNRIFIIHIAPVSELPHRYLVWPSVCPGHDEGMVVDTTSARYYITFLLSYIQETTSLCCTVFFCGWRS